MKDTKIISAFPACGKTFFYENFSSDMIILDSDSSKFSWIYRKRTDDELAELKRNWDMYPHKLDSDSYINSIRDEEIKVRNPDFPNNYISHIKENIGKVDYIFVSSHESVRDALTEANLDYVLIYPARFCKAEWIGRCFIRGSGESFCKLINDNWDTWLIQLDNDVLKNNRTYFRLRHDQYLSDAIQYLGGPT